MAVEVEAGEIVVVAAVLVVVAVPEGRGGVESAAKRKIYREREFLPRRQP